MAYFFKNQINPLTPYVVCDQVLWSKTKKFAKKYDLKGEGFFD